MAKKKSNAAKTVSMRRTPRKGTGWIEASRVKIQKRGGKTTVLIQKPRRRAKRKK